MLKSYAARCEFVDIRRFPVWMTAEVAGPIVRSSMEIKITFGRSPAAVRICSESRSAVKTAPSVIITIYVPVSENRNFFAPFIGEEAEGNCVVAGRGGKQPKAKEWYQIQVNSIR